MRESVKWGQEDAGTVISYKFLIDRREHKCVFSPLERISAHFDMHTNMEVV